jgi:type II secretory pathway component PulF
MAADQPGASGKSATASKLSPDELIALTDEMAALVRAGVPLEKGLAHVADDLARRPGNVAAQLAQRIETGESLSHALGQMGESFPPVYGAVVDAGLRSGRLSAALEGLAASSRRVAELRRLTRLAMIYPIFLVFLAYGLFVCAIVWFQPRLAQLYDVMDVPASSLNLRLIDLGRTAPPWAVGIPIVAVVVLLLWWFNSKRAAAKTLRGWHFGPVDRLLYYSQLAAFTDLLALLLENGTPLPEAIVLAASAEGDKRLRNSAAEFSRLVAAGVQSRAADQQALPALLQSAGFPPLVSWLLVSGAQQEALVESLHNTAQAYHHRAQRLDDWLRLYIPLVFVVVIGGAAVLIYALSLLGPWYQMLTHIGSSLK